MSYIDYLPADGNFSEGELWEAIAEANGIDVNEIMDGDLVDFI
jgi:transketolase N-terminal domain/subunit